MSFSFVNLLRFAWQWLTGLPWTPRRALMILASVIVVPVVEAFVWAGLLLDWILFPGFRRQRVDEPLYIVGNYRSGTTFLHRLIAADRARFTTMQMWEILFAPSVSVRRLCGGLAAVDRALGRPVPRFLRWLESRWHESNVMHEVSMTEPEEDEYLCLHAWSSLAIGLSAGLLDDARRYVHFDTELTAPDRQRIMRFYAGCVRRHMLARAGRGHRYLAKNPGATPKIAALTDQFPDAKFVYLVRNPLEAVPSFYSLMRFTWRIIGIPDDLPAQRDFVLDMTARWYRRPLEQLAELPDDRYRIVVYDDLVRDPERTVRDIYEHFGWEIDDGFAATLAAASAAAADYVSRHDYSLDELGIDRDAFVERFADVFERFGFEGPE